VRFVQHLLSRFAPRAGFAARRQTFVRRGQNCGVGLQSFGADRWASRYGIKAGGTAGTLAAGTRPWSDAGVAFETPRQHAGAPLAATSSAHSRSLDALPLARDLLLSANQLFVHRQR
jgi:hypothetical protein